MALALIVLAIGSVAAGYIGIPHALGGNNALATWLEPAFETQAAATAPVAADVATPAEPAVGGGGHSAEAAHDEVALERTLMGVSIAIAILGIVVATAIWLRRRQFADSMARTFGPVYRLLLNKYYVDELYDATIVQPIKIVSQEGLWRGMDVRLVDGAVNGAGQVVGALSAVLRLFQTGSVKAYAAGTFLGAVAILAFYLWR